jgi:hypothetical protein
MAVKTNFIAIIYFYYYLFVNTKNTKLYYQAASLNYEKSFQRNNVVFVYKLILLLHTYIAVPNMIHHCLALNKKVQFSCLSIKYKI